VLLSLSFALGRRLVPLHAGIAISGNHGISVTKRYVMLVQVLQKVKHTLSQSAAFRILPTERSKNTSHTATRSSTSKTPQRRYCSDVVYLNSFRNETVAPLDRVTCFAHGSCLTMRHNQLAKPVENPPSKPKPCQNRRRNGASKQKKRTVSVSWSSRRANFFIFPPSFEAHNSRGSG
jgi:hypothetical protein